MFRLKILKTPELKIFGHLQNMTSTYLGKICINFLDLLFFKCSEKAGFFSKSEENA